MLIRSKAMGVNPVDIGVREGQLDALLAAHFPVVSIQWGSYAELVAAPSRAVAHKPASLSWEQAAALTPGCSKPS